MAGKIQLEIVTPEKAVVSEEAQIVMAPGSLGEFGVLTGHTPFLTALKVGTVKYVDGSGKERFVFVSGGFAEALPDKVTILAESAERRKNIDSDRANEALKRAEERLAAGKADKQKVDQARARAALDRAMARMSLVRTL